MGPTTVARCRGHLRRLRHGRSARSGAGHGAATGGTTIIYELPTGHQRRRSRLEIFTETDGRPLSACPATAVRSTAPLPEALSSSPVHLSYPASLIAAQRAGRLIQAPDPADFSAYWAAAGDMDGDATWTCAPGMAGDDPTTTATTPAKHTWSAKAIADILGCHNGRRLTESIPQRAALWQNYPNPLTDRRASAMRSRASRVELAIYTLLGQRIATLAGKQGVGVHTAYWDGRSDAYAVASGAHLSTLRRRRTGQNARIAQRTTRTVAVHQQRYFTLQKQLSHKVSQ